jgi:hypothetical protein
MNHQHKRAGGETIHECEGRDLSQAAAFRFQLQNLLAAYQLLWTTELLAIRLRMPNPGAYPLPNQVALKLRDSRNDSEQRLPQRAARVNVPDSASRSLCSKGTGRLLPRLNVPPPRVFLAVPGRPQPSKLESGYTLAKVVLAWVDLATEPCTSK